MRKIACLFLLAVYFLIGSKSFSDVLIVQATTEMSISGNVDTAGNPITTVMALNALGVPVAGAGANSTAVTFAQIDILAAYAFDTTIYDTLGAAHTIHLAFFHVGNTAPQYAARAYALSEDLGETVSGYPRQITNGSGNSTTGTIFLSFAVDGARTGFASPDISYVIPWGNGSSTTRTVATTFMPITSLAASSALSATQDGFPPTLVTPTPSPTVTPTGTVTPANTPSPRDTPAPLQIKTEKNHTQFLMGPTGAAAYSLSIKNTTRRYILITTDPSPSINYLERKRWRARYRIKYSDGTHSAHTDWVQFNQK